MRRCQKSGLECDGPKGTAFIEGTIVKSRRSLKSASPGTKHDIREQDTALQSISQSAISLRYNQNEVYICYARKHLLPNGPIDLGLQDLRLADITPTSGRSTAKGPVFNHAVLSFATVFFGAEHRQASILTEGYGMHGAALKQLNSALSDSRCYVRDEVILSVITLAMLECLVPTGPQNYMKHMLGLEKLLALRELDAIAHCSTKTSDLYKGTKYMILFASVRARTPSILARPEWKAAMRVNCSSEGLQEQDLCDVLADCTVLLAERDKLAPRWNQHVRQQVRLISNAMSSLAYLHGWKERWDADYDEKSAFEESPRPGDRNWQLSPASSVDNESHCLPTALRLESDAVARMLMLYNTTLIYVLQLLASLPYESPESLLDDYNNNPNTNRHYETPSLRPWQCLPHQDDDIWQCIANGEWTAAERLAALQIGRCIPSYLDHKRARSDPQFSSPVVQWAVTTAWTTLGGDDTAEGRWIRASRRDPSILETF
ncbi:hypothetical protein N0V83_001759 [Neocucurbitaria cava]|uniref:Uncharacterized protein n=1 Tax=Neocucurbitaria cava TaxID=798079 RepID=A0A9W8YGC3_9PLEO|nr:hypothetical protein N0V83_001759 [Neocucurbitaria cava]